MDHYMYAEGLIKEKQLVWYHSDVNDCLGNLENREHYNLTKDHVPK